MYPTVMEDTNGNQITVTYSAGLGVSWANSSARISSIKDVRGGYPNTFTFTFNADAIPHITSITNTLGTAENFSFTIIPRALQDPFTSSSYGTTSLLAYLTQTGTNLTTTFYYDGHTSGEWTQIRTPYGGQLTWSYVPFTYVGGRTQREVQTRYLIKTAGGPQTVYNMARPDPGDVNRSIHYYAALDDPDGKSEKVWVFNYWDPTLPSIGLLVEHYTRLQVIYASNPWNMENYDYAADAAGNPYISSAVTTVDYNVPTAQQKKTTQTLDQYGNLTQMQVFDYGNLSTPARTYNNSYVTNPNYTSRYILNRLSSSTVTDSAGKTATLSQIGYDGLRLADQPGMPMHDAAYNADFPYYRGLPTTITRLGLTTVATYDIGGNGVTSTMNGVASSTLTNGSTNYAAPSQITTGSLNTSMNWTAFLGLSSQTGPNGDTAFANYDANARPAITTSPYGAQTTYTYNDIANPPTRTATTNGHWVRTTMDGFGRTIKTETGDGSGTKSVVDSVYGSCGCSPLGKLTQVSQPHAPGAAVYWTTYNYDYLGRTISSVAPDGSTTRYAYWSYVVQVTDPAGKWKQYVVNALGNLIQVRESNPAAPSDPNQDHWTYYSYDVLNHLTQVTMPRAGATQTRTFNYTTGNTVGAFLLSATNPENGTVNYTYNGDGTLATKTDARGTQLVYSYDYYKRLTQVAYGASVLRTYYYDSNPLDPNYSQNAAGRLTAIQYAPNTFDIGAQGPSSSSTLTDMFSYTAAGGISGKRLRTSKPYGNNQTAIGDLNLSYSYNNEGKVTAVTYPDTVSGPGSHYTYSFDSMMRPVGMTDQNNNPLVSTSCMARPTSCFR